MPPRLKPTGCYPMTVTAEVEYRAYRKVSQCAGLASRNLPTGCEARISGKNIVNNGSVL